MTGCWPLAASYWSASREQYGLVVYYYMGDKTIYENDWSYFVYRLSVFLYGATVLI